MDKFEYRTYNFFEILREQQKELKEEFHDEELADINETSFFNKIGKDGWELISIDHKYPKKYFFKKLIN